MPSRSKNMVSMIKIWLSIISLVYICYIQCLLIVIIWNCRLLGTFQIVDSQTHRLLENWTQGRHSHFAISQCSPVLWISSSEWTVYRWLEVCFLLTAEETRGFNIISSKLQCLELPWMWLPDTFISSMVYLLFSKAGLGQLDVWVQYNTADFS